MNESAVSKKEIFFIVILMMVIMDMFFFVAVVFYDFSERLTNKKENLIECTVVKLETDWDRYSRDGAFFIQYYTILEKEDGNTIKITQTYKDFVGRKVLVYSDGYTGGLRKDYEIKRMNIFDIICTIGFPFTIYVIIKVIVVLIKDKKNEK